MEWFVYILQSEKDGRFYIGASSDVPARIARHNSGGVDATKYRKPLRLVHIENCPDKVSAMKRERYLKSLKSHTAIQDLIDAAG